MIHFTWRRLRVLRVHCRWGRLRERHGEVNCSNHAGVALQERGETHRSLPLHSFLRLFLFYSNFSYTNESSTSPPFSFFFFRFPFHLSWFPTHPFLMAERGFLPSPLLFNLTHPPTLFPQGGGVPVTVLPDSNMATCAWRICAQKMHAFRHILMLYLHPANCIFMNVI